MGQVALETSVDPHKGLTRKEVGDWGYDDLRVAIVQERVDPRHHRFLGVRDHQLEMLLGGLEERTALAPKDEQDRLRDAACTVAIEG